jgi:hypothetical protein
MLVSLITTIGVLFTTLFMYLESLSGPHEIDWFANDDNHKLLVFYSSYWTANSKGIDAFTIE